MNPTLRATAVAALSLAFPGAGLCQALCPENVIRIVSPFPAGGPTDVAARVIAEKLKDRVGHNVIVENRAGAGGATGTGYVAQQPGNGCTVLLSYDSHAVNPVLLNLPFDTATAFKPVVMIGSFPNIIAAHPSQPFKTFAEMVIEAKKEKDRLAYATGGTGTVGHLSMKLIEQHYGMQLRNVPYRGGAPALNDLVAGQIDGGHYAASGFEINPATAGTPHEAACDAGLLMLALALREAGRDGWERYAACAERFLREFYVAQRAHLEQRMLFGQRREDKFSKK